MPIEWTNQHGCGGNEDGDPNTLNCNMVVQYTCDSAATVLDTTMMIKLRDGTTTTQVGTDGSPGDQSRGVHESAAYYSYCSNRLRNKGLFTADQDLRNRDHAVYTRQNPNDNRRGLECPEERDYYPYWLPTPWIDVAYLTDNMDPIDTTYGLCDYVRANTQNLNTKYRCRPNDPTQDTTNTNVISLNSQGECTTANGNWRGYQHFNPSVTLAAADIQKTYGVDCGPAPYSRANQLGNSRNGQPITYNWTLPVISVLKEAQIKTYTSGGAEFAKCVLRLRYNISTDDYDPWNTNSTFNNDPNTGTGKSPVTQNPTVDVGDMQALKLAINTNQFGRTFQDRSHTFFIRARPSNVNGLAGSSKIYNLNVRGKRGNIVQTYPAVEYDFVPNRLHVTENDFVHIQWTGSNTHNNGGGGGDGQAGDAGEGTDGTDRSNFMQMGWINETFPLALDKESSIFSNIAKFYQLDGSEIVDPINAALWLATSGFYTNRAGVGPTAGATDTLDTTLDNAPPSLAGGMLMRVNGGSSYSSYGPGVFNYMCTRNNSFSNRTQKGTLIVSAAPATPAA